MRWRWCLGRTNKHWNLQQLNIIRYTEMEHPTAFLASNDPDVVHHHQAMRADDSDQFAIAVDKEISEHEKYKHFVPVLKDKVPAGTRVIDMMWLMRRKLWLDTGEVYKWKSRLLVACWTRRDIPTLNNKWRAAGGHFNQTATWNLFCASSVYYSRMVICNAQTDSQVRMWWYVRTHSGTRGLCWFQVTHQ